MNFKEYFLISEIETLLESPVLTTKAAGINSLLVDPKTGKAWRYKSLIQRLKLIRDQQQKNGIDPKEIWVSFSNVTRLGIYPKASDGSTPIGLYAYPINYVIEKQGDVPYGEDRRYLLVFRAKRKNVISIEEKGKEEISDFRDVFEHLSEEGIRSKLEGFLNKRKRVLSKFVYNIIDKLKNESLQNAIAGYLDRVISHVFDTIETRLVYANHTKEIAKIDDIMRELTDSSDYKKDRIEEQMKEYILNQIKIRYGDAGSYQSKVNKYKEIDPKTFSAKLSDQALEMANRYQDSTKEWHDLLQILREKDNNFSSQERAFEKNAMLWIFLFSGYSKTKIGEKIKKSVDSLKGKIEYFVEEFRKKHEEIKNSIDFPFKQELKQFAEKNDLDWFNAFVRTLSSLNSSNKQKISGSFVYRFTEQLAMQMSKKSTSTYEAEYNTPTSKKYYVIWMKILKQLGFSGLADEQGTGTIHSGEPTQGVFFDPKQFELITIINNDSHISSTEPDYSGHDGSEYRKLKQRRGRSTEWDAEDSALGRWFSGLIYKTSDLEHETFLRSYAITHPTEHFRIITKVLIVIKTFLKFKEKINQDASSDNIDLFKVKIKRIKTNLESNYERLKKYIEDMPQETEQNIKNSLSRAVEMYEKAFAYIDNLEQTSKAALPDIKKIKWSAYKNLQGRGSVSG